MAGIVTNPYTQLAALGNQQAGAGAQMAQYNVMANLLGNYLNQAMNPQNLAQGTASQTQPLSAGAVENIQNQVGGNIAERGLSQSPNIWQANLAQAESYPLLSMQQQGIQNYMQGQKLPFMVPHPAVSMPSVPQTSSALSSGLLGFGAGTALGGL